MTESQLERKVVEWCRDEGILTYKFSSPAHRGVPDRIFLYAGRIMFLEFKQAGKKPTALQMRELSLLRSVGFTALWTSDFGDATSILGNFKKNYIPTDDIRA